ncbi:MAG: ABC transporter ATP-binding protein [Bacteroidales bacterium]|nr:ABC transporter ATP-binding protein [Bacteroidales bacterium]
MDRKDRIQAITIADLTKNFGTLKAVDNLSLEIEKGEIFGLLGPNGAGKSTTIKILCGLLKPDGGNVFISGMMPGKRKETLHKIGLCPQDNNFWPKLSCIEQLTFTGIMHGLSPGGAMASAITLLDRLGLQEKRNKLAHTLSGGMKRRLNLALALVHHPEILILDEPEAGLDPQSRVMVREFIMEIAADKTVILTSHNMDEVKRLAQRIAIIDHGRLLLTGTPVELKKTVGEGDILEIDLIEKLADNKEIEKLLQPVSNNIRVINNSITIRSMNAVELLPGVCNHLQKNGIVYSNIRLRGNTLEDVFIHLTGRRLREWYYYTSLLNVLKSNTGVSGCLF